jgi:hypothetical protein
MENAEVARTWWSPITARSELGGSAQRERWGLCDYDDDIVGGWDGQLAGAQTPWRTPKRHGRGRAMEGSRGAVVVECGRSAVDVADSGACG